MSTYSGAPDECSRCWPHKQHDGRCEEECPGCREMVAWLNDHKESV